MILANFNKWHFSTLRDNSYQGLGEGKIQGKLNEINTVLILNWGKEGKVTKLVQFQFLKSGRTNNQTLLEHLQEKKVVKMSYSDSAFIKNEPCQNIFFPSWQYNRPFGYRKSSHIVTVLPFRKLPNALSHGLLIGKLGKQALDGISECCY